MAAVLAATYPDLFTAAGIHSGLAYGAAHDLSSAYAAMRDGPPANGKAAGGTVPLIVFQGDRDSTVAPANAAALLSPWSGSVPPEVVSGPGWTRRVYRDGDGHPAAEWWSVHRLGHAWSGGSPEGSFTKPAGPDASAELVRFFSEVTHRGQERRRSLRAWLGGG
jgi:poly(3-hydroxybutyrate) depolymerase